MLLVGAILLAVFVLPRGWGIAVIAAAAAVEIAETFLWLRLSRRGRIRAGPEALVGARGRAVDDCRPEGRVRVAGELWRARCEPGVAAGEAVRVLERDGLVLRVEPVSDP